MDNLQKSRLQRLKELRKEKGLSQSELGEELNIPRGTIAGYEAGSRTPEVSTLIELSEYFDVSVDYFLGFSEIRSTLKADSLLGKIYQETKNDKGLADCLEKLVTRNELILLAKYVKDLPYNSIIELIQHAKTLEEKLKATT